MIQRSLAVLFLAFVVSVPPPAASPTDALAAYVRFKALDGSWEGVSSKGWTDQVTFKTIAAGSAVIETSFGAHPGETMLTTYVLDGDRLLLTHYCVAKNQPRLVATEIEDDAKTVTFTFLDATNLASRNRGHMDRATFHFVDDDHVTTRWSWYQDGKETWMEEIRMARRHTKS
jgi:GH24 family phage-related lysozyme (muramidase)